MQGGLNSGQSGRGSAYVAATSTQPATTNQGQPVTEREAVRVGEFSLTMEELLVLAVMVNAFGTLAALYLGVT